tara:strand:- start:971 stop:1534 length:564 start_codon:yes stop_codon:yes gene_type:complete
MVLRYPHKYPIYEPQRIAQCRLEMYTIDYIYLNQDLKKIQTTIDYYLYKRKSIAKPNTINKIIDLIENEKDLTQIEVKSFKEIQKFALSFNFSHVKDIDDFYFDREGDPFVDFSGVIGLMDFLIYELNYFKKNKNVFFKELEKFKEWYSKTDELANALLKECTSYEKKFDKKIKEWLGEIHQPGYKI